MALRPLPLPGTSLHGGTKAVSEGVTDPSATAIDPASVGPRLGGYEILSCVGRGSMGAVYKAKQVTLDRTVALKTVRNDLCADPDLIGRFLKEARTVGQFNAEHVVQIYDAGFDQGHHFIVMEFVGGGSLGAYASRQPGGLLSVEDALRFLHQAAEGLLEAERLKIVHRDIKPGNLLLDSRGRLKIADFGIAKALGTDLEATATCANILVGTPLYMSPEQAEGSPLDHRSDMYSLGATVFHLLTGVPPVEAESIPDAIRKKRVITRLSPRAVAGAEGIPEGLARIIERMTALRPHDRYPSFQALIDDIEIARGAAPTTRRKVGARPESRGPRRRSGRLWAAALGCLLIVLAGMYWTVLRGPHGPGRTTDPGEKGPRHGAGSPTVGASSEAPAKASSEASSGASVEAPVEAPTVGGKTAPPVALACEELRGALDRLQARLATDGPTEPLLAEAEGLGATLRQARSCPAEWLEEATALSRDLREGLKRRLSAETLDAEALSVTPPFGAVLGRWKGIEEALRPSGEAGDSLRDWLGRERGKRLEDLEKMCSLAASSLLERAQEEAERFRKWEVDASSFGLLLRQLEESRGALLSLFGRCEVPEETLRELQEELAKRAAAMEGLAALGSSLELLEGRLAGIGGPSLWTTENAGEVATTLREVSDRLRALGESETAAPLAEARARLEGARMTAARLTEDRSLWLAALGSFGGRDLEGAERPLKELISRRPGDKASERVLAASLAIRGGFEALLGTLDLARAKREFESAVEGLEGLEKLGGAEGLAGAEAAVEYAVGCRDRLSDLERSAQSMAPVQGGEALIPERGALRREGVEPFLIDRCEVSVGEYRDFAATYGSVLDFEKVKDLWPDAETFRRFGSGAALSPPYFTEALGLDPRYPVEEVSYHQALAFARSRRKDLPRLAEWFLAARGRPEKGVYPYDVPSLEIHCRAHGPLPVDQSGETRGFPSRCSVHHLAGNVAEWCLAETGEPGRAELVGGRFADTDRRYFTGERRDILPLSTRSRGYGFRGVIRPRAFFGGLVPGEGH